jgi:hypothetical protein
VPGSGSDISFGLGEVLIGPEVEEGVDAVGGCRVLAMELFYGSLGMVKVGLWFPRVFFISVAF